MAKPSKFFSSYFAEYQYARLSTTLLQILTILSYARFHTLIYTTLLAVGMENEVKDDVNIDDLVDDSDEGITKEAVALMRKKLPEYVVNSFITARYDKLEVIAGLKTKEEPGNSLDEIESYINKECAGDSRFHREGASSMLFKIPPGHRHQIGEGSCAAHVRREKESKKAPHEK